MAGRGSSQLFCRDTRLAGRGSAPGLGEIPGVCAKQGGVWVVLNCGAEKGGGALGQQTVQRPLPNSISSPSLGAGGLPSTAKRVGQGGAVRSKPCPSLYPFSASRTSVPGEGCFQQSPDLGPIPACPPRGPPSAGTMGTLRGVQPVGDLSGLNCFPDI